jgi:ribosomal protein L20A (L18A)
MVNDLDITSLIKKIINSVYSTLGSRHICQESNCNLLDVRMPCWL